MRMPQLLGGASSFVHFAGIGLGGKRAEEPKDDEPKGKKSKAAEDDDEDDQPKGKKSEEPTDDEPKGKKSKAAEGEEDDDEDDQPKGKKSRRARADEDEDDEYAEDDDDKDEMHGRSAVANARRRERARCAAILGSTHAAGNVDLAASLAFNTTMTRKEAVAVLKGTAPRDAQSDDLRSVDRRNRNPDIGAAGPSTSGGQKAIDSGWDRAIAKVTPASRK